jgi:hypothetical protein
MRSGLTLALLFLGCTLAGSAQEAASRDEPVVTTYLLRTGEQFQAPHVLTYRMVEWEQQRGRWTYPDLGAYQASGGELKLLFVGAGVDLHPGKKALLTQEVYFMQEAGPGSRGARSLWIWPILDLNFTPRLSAEAVAYPTIPLDRASHPGFDVDRAKVEYATRLNLIVGAGYSASKCEGAAWQNKPFLTTTFLSHSNSFEFWLQRIPGGGQLQVRYKLVRSGR